MSWLQAVFLIADSHPTMLRVGQEHAGTVSSVRVPVTLITGGLRSAAARLRRLQPNIWTGLAWIPATDAGELVQP